MGGNQCGEIDTEFSLLLTRPFVWVSKPLRNEVFNLFESKGRGGLIGVCVVGRYRAAGPDQVRIVDGQNLLCHVCHRVLYRYQHFCG